MRVGNKKRSWKNVEIRKMSEITVNNRNYYFPKISSPGQLP